MKRRKKRKAATIKKREIKNVHDSIQFYGDGECWEPSTQDDTPTNDLPGSPEKLDVMRQRLDDGKEIWHDKDRVSYDDED